MEKNLRDDSVKGSSLLAVFSRFVGSGLLSTLADNLTFYLLINLGLSSAWSLIGGRVVSLCVNYLLLRFTVFQGKRKNDHSLPRYLLLVAFSTTVVWLLLQLSSRFVSAHPVIPKIVIEGLMFFFNFYVSKKFVFRNGESDEPQG